MSSQQSTINDRTLRHQRVTLLELLDRLLDKGVVVKGEVLLSVADVDLVYLNLGLLLSSVKTVEEVAHKYNPEDAIVYSRQALSPRVSLEEQSPEVVAEDDQPVLSRPQEAHQRSESAEASTLSSAADEEQTDAPSSSKNIDQENVEKGLAQLVLTLVDLIRKLMEKQAIRRIEAEQLSEQEIENIGNAFFLLAEKMEELKITFGLSDEELNLDLGPLGELV